MFLPMLGPSTPTLFLLPTYPMPEKVLIVNIILGAQSLGDAISSEDKIITKSKLTVVTYISY
jgi:hypothetical protein